MKRCLIVFFLFLWLPFISLRAQPAFYTFSDLGVEHGLSQNTVYSLFQDSRGFLWVGTADGLNRYDGHGFKVFKHNPEDTNSLSSSVIRYIFEDRSGKLWISTEGGLNVYDSERDQFKKVTPAAVPGKSYMDKVLAEDDAGRLWLLRYGTGLIGYEPKTGRAEVFLHTKRRFPAYQDFSYFDVKEQKLWIASTDTLSCFDIGKRKFLHYPLWKKADLEGSYIMPFRNRFLLMTGESGLQVFDLKEHRFIKDGQYSNIGFPSMRLKGIELDKNGHLWLATYENGIILYDSSGQKIAQYKPEQGCGDCLNTSLLTCIIKDQSGNIWLGTDGGGVVRVHGLKRKFQLLVAKDRNPYGFSDHYFRSIIEDRKGQVWAGTLAGGVNILDRKTGKMRHLGTRTNPAIPSDNIFSILEDRYNRIWIATAGGVCLYTPETDKLENVPMPEAYGELRHVNRIIERANGEFWLCFKNVGLFYGRLEPGQKPDFRVFEPLRGRVFTALYEDRDKNLWLVNSADIFVIDTKNKLVSHPWQKRISDYASKNFATAVCEDQYGNMWLGSHNGAARIDKTTGDFAYLNENNGLANNYVYNILADNSGHMWVSSNKGLSRINARTLEVRNYTPKDGLQSYEFNSHACYKSRSGIFYWGGIYGINYFHPDSIKDDLSRARLSLTGFAVNEKAGNLLRWLGESGELLFAHDQNYLYFEFAATDLTYPGTVNYAYRVKGLDNEWHYLGNQHFIRLNGLAPGTYTLEVKATNSDGIWNPDVLSYAIRVKPPYWATDWFRILMTITVIGLVALAVAWYSRQRYSRKLAELQRRQEIEQIRNRISRDIHDEIGSGLTRISIISERLKRNIKGQADGISQTLDNLQTQSRNMVGSLNEIVWTVNPLNDRLDSLMAYIRNYAADYLENGGLDYHFDFPDEIPELQISPELRRNLFLVVKEALNNTLKYAGASRVDMQFSIDETGAFVLTITDNGKGMNTSQKAKGGGNGLRNIHSRIQEVGGICRITSGPGKGVQIKITATINVNTTF